MGSIPTVHDLSSREKLEEPRKFSKALYLVSSKSVMAPSVKIRSTKYWLALLWWAAPSLEFRVMGSHPDVTFFSNGAINLGCRDSYQKNVNGWSLLITPVIPRKNKPSKRAKKASSFPQNGNKLCFLPGYTGFVFLDHW